MMFMIPTVYQGGKTLDENFAPPADAVEAMTKYNEELAKAGALISLDGLQPPNKGARIAFAQGRRTVTDGPFAETKEVVGGYWMIKADSLQEAVEWAKRVPAADGDVVEVRQVFDMSDFPEDVQRAADNPTVKAQLAGATNT
jgi:hypothetical protein